MSTDIYDQFNKRFADGARTLSRKKEYRNQKELVIKGKLNFKRRVLGFFGWKTKKSIDELAEILTDLRMVKPTEDAKGVAQELNGGYGEYFIPLILSII